MKNKKDRTASRERRRSDRAVLLRLVQEAKPIYKWLALACLISLGIIACAVAAPQLLGDCVQQLYDYWAGSFTGASLTAALTGGCLALAGVYLLQGLMSWMKMLLLNNVVSRYFTCALRIKLSAKISRLPVSFVDRTPVGQKLPIFSGSGMRHNDLAAQIVRQAKIANDESAQFCIVFAAMGVQKDVADYFRRSFDESGVLQKVVMFVNLANDPVIERTLTPRCALTAAEYLAFEKNMHVLVVMTDMTSYAEALREFSSSKGEIPGRGGYPGYLYSDLASMYERAGMVKGREGSVTQIPILTMPNDDITQPVPDLTGYITEGQIVLDRSLEGGGIYPPVSVLPSLSRLMKDGIGAGFTRADHQDLANQLFASYSKVMDARSLASVIGEEELSPNDKRLLEFGRLFEERFITQGSHESRSIEQSLNLGWELLSTLPRSELDRVDPKLLDEFYKPKNLEASDQAKVAAAVDLSPEDLTSQVKSFNEAQ